MRKEAGFTLIELIIVIAILGILAMILLPKFTGFIESSKKSAIRSEATSIKKAVEAIEAEKGTYTTNDQDVWNYLGKDFTNAKDGNKKVSLELGSDGSFTYTKIINGVTLTAKCEKDENIIIEEVKETVKKDNK